jgi:hypothetical protein
MHICQDCKTTSGDMVNEPTHYTQGSIQPLDYIKANEMSYEEGCIIKYITRYKYKHVPLEDLQKLERYLKSIMKDYE